jgi:hypothetical protein
MKRIALRHTLQPRIGVRQQEQSIGFGFCPTLVIGGTGGEASPALDELFGLPENVPQLVIGSDIEVCRALQDIVPSMDISISAEVAAGFTSQTQTLVGKDISIGESVEQGNGSDLEQFFGVVEPKDCQWITTDEVCAALEQIMQTIDHELTASMAQSITQSITQA